MTKRGKFNNYSPNRGCPWSLNFKNSQTFPSFPDSQKMSNTPVAGITRNTPRRRRACGYKCLEITKSPWRFHGYRTCGDHANSYFPPPKRSFFPVFVFIFRSRRRRPGALVCVRYVRPAALTRSDVGVVKREATSVVTSSGRLGRHLVGSLRAGASFPVPPPSPPMTRRKRKRNLTTKYWRRAEKCASAAAL